MDHPFRGAMFGGFNRQDVLNYLESTAQQAAKELEEQRDRAEGLELEVTDLRREQESAQAELKHLRQEAAQYKQEQEKAQNELEVLRRDNERKQKELQQATVELEQLRAKVALLAPDAEAYATVKERTAGVELEAHRRAQNVEARAKIMAGDLQRQMEQWMGKVEQQYAGLKSEIQNSVERANQQLVSAGQTLNRVNALMGEQEAALKAVAKSYSDAVQNKKVD